MTKRRPKGREAISVPASQPSELIRNGSDLQSTESKLRVSEEKYRALFELIDAGFCVIEVLFDDANKPIDYRYLQVNRTFEKQTGISNAVGRRMREIAPAHEEPWFQIYSLVALTGAPRRFESRAVALGRFYDVYAFRFGQPRQRQVALLFNDITGRKQAEEERGRLIQERRETEVTAKVLAMARLSRSRCPLRSAGQAARRPRQ
jgi:PAS domain S-box-containing protein